MTNAHPLTKIPLLTAIVSTYNAERFMAGCLDNLLGQTIANDIEILVIDSGSTQAESSITQYYADSNPNIKIIRTKREGLYSAWNRGVKAASGKYLTTANTDDRHRLDALEILTNTLESNPSAVLAYADQLVSTVENEGYSECYEKNPKTLRWPDFSPERIFMLCTTGPQPVWRASVHAKIGFFDESLNIAGDGEFWIRLAQEFEFIHIPEPLGTFFESPFTLSGNNNAFNRDMETMRVQLRHLNFPMWKTPKKLRSTLSNELFGVGYRYVQAGKPDLCRPFLRCAWQLAPANISFLKTYIYRGLLGIRQKNTLSYD